MWLALCRHAARNSSRSLSFFCGHFYLFKLDEKCRKWGPNLIYALSVQYGSYYTKTYLRSLSTVWLLLYQILFTLPQYSMALTVPNLIYAFSVQYGSYCTKSYLRSLSTVWLLLYRFSRICLCLNGITWTSALLNLTQSVKKCGNQDRNLFMSLYKHDSPYRFSRNIGLCEVFLWRIPISNFMRIRQTI